MITTILFSRFCKEFIGSSTVVCIRRSSTVWTRARDFIAKKFPSLEIPNSMVEGLLRDVDKPYYLSCHNCLTVSENIEQCDKLTRQNKLVCLRELLSHFDGEIDWDQVMKRFNILTGNSLMEKTMTFVIMRHCFIEELYGEAQSYLKYLLDNKKMNLLVFKEFCSYMKLYPEDFKSSAELIYNILITYGPKSEEIVNHCCRCLFQFPSYYQKCLEIIENIDTQHIHSAVVSGAIQMNDYETAMKHLKLKRGKVANVDLYISLISSLCEEIKLGKVHEEVIWDIIKLLPKYIHMGAVVEVLAKLYTTLNEVDNKYKWTASKCYLKNGECNICSKTVTYNDVTTSDLELLLNAFVRDIFIQDDIYLNSNSEEWNKFKKYVDETQYNIVMDCLNIIFFFNSDVNSIQKFFDNLVKLNCIPLIVARKHVKRRSDIFSIVMKYPYFLTENLSSDDMFVVYAALKKGKDCFFISRDRMGFCHNKLRGKEKEIFEIWRNTHNCQVTRGGKLIFPVRYEDKFYLQEDVDGHFLHYTGVKDRKIVGWCYSTTRRSSKFSDSDEEGISMRNMTPRDYRHELERVKARIEEMREQHMKERHAKERNKRKKFIY